MRVVWCVYVGLYRLREEGKVMDIPGIQKDGGVEVYLKYNREVKELEGKREEKDRNV